MHMVEIHGTVSVDMSVTVVCFNKEPANYVDSQTLVPQSICISAGYLTDFGCSSSEMCVRHSEGQHGVLYYS